MTNKRLYWRLHQAKQRKMRVLKEKKEQKQTKKFSTFLKLNVDFERKK